MKKFLYSILLIFIFLLISTVTYLSIIGLETSKFNNLIIKKIEKKDARIKLKLETIKIKLDIKKVQLFLSTDRPKITYQNIKIPITNIKIYTELNKIFNSKVEISQITFGVEDFKIQEIQKIAIRIKPSNFKTYLLNNINGGKIEKALFDVSIDKDFKITDYKANGSIKNINGAIKNNFILKNISFNFIIDKNLTLINSVNARYKGIFISNGSINLQREEEINIKGNFNSQFDLKEYQLNELFEKVKFFKENKIKTKGSLLHSFYLKMNNNFKIIDYDYKSSGNISEAEAVLKNDYTNKLINKSIKKILFKKIKFETNFNIQNNNSLILDGLYSYKDLNYNKFKFKQKQNKEIKNFFIDLNLTENINIDVINFRLDSVNKSNLKVEYNVRNKKSIFKSIVFTEGKNIIHVKDLVLNNKNQIDKFSNIRIQTFNKNEENNNFVINFGKKISITGKKYDSSNLLASLSNSNKSSQFKKITKELEIKIKYLITESKTPLSNFNLIGLIEKGKLSKISAKGEFSKERYLDISLKKDPNNKKILEVYSDIPQALLSDYKFFEGIKDGKLLYRSVIDTTGSASKLTIENFKVTKAPAFATLLTLADLSGFADLLSGQGMSFDILEVDLKENSEETTIEEILALGSSVSLHMKGYIEKKTGLISLSGTLVPAKMLNNIVSKIPFVGNILVGSKVGEGVFGVSFKMKGLPGKVKTTVNPVKTITPRFITRAIEKMKK